MNNDFYRQIVDSLEDYAVLTTDLKGRINSWSSGAENILGYNKTEIIGHDAAVIFIPKDRRQGKPDLELQTALKQGRAADEKWHRRKDGSTFWGSGVVFPLKDDAGAVVGFSKIMRDLTQQKLSDEKNEAEKHRRSEILESIGDAFFALDSAWNFTYVNTQMEKIVLRKRKRLIGKNIWRELWGGEASAKQTAFYKQYHLAVKTGLPVHFEEFHPLLKVWLSVHAYPAKDGLSVYFTDISERRHAEELLRYQKSLLEAQQEVSPEGELIVSAEGKMVSYNRRFAEMWKFPSKVFGSKLDIKALHAAQEQLIDPDGFMLRVQELYENRSKSHEKLYFKDGRVFDRYGSPVISEDGTYYGYVWFFRDISNQEASEKALKDSEERLRFMAESMPQKIFTATADGSVDYFNPQWEEYTGLSFKQIRDWGWLQFIHPDDVDENIRQWNHSIKTGKPFQFEHRFRRADGEYRWHLSRAHALKDKPGKTIMWIGSNTDIDDFRRTTQRKHELEGIAKVLREQQAQLVALNEAKDEFIALASHQLRTPATGVKQYTAMLLEGYAGDVTDEQRDMLKRVYDSNERQLATVNDLLNVARVDAGKVRLNRTSFDIVQLVCDVIQEQAAKFNTRQQKLIYRELKGTSSVDIDADKALIRMVIENLVDNAGKYSPEGKTVSISLRQTSRQTEIFVEDQGVGISKKDQAKLFQKFTRIDNPLSAAVGGSGLGLYWAKEIIDLHRGQLTVSSKSRAGSKFTIALPRNATS